MRVRLYEDKPVLERLLQEGHEAWLSHTTVATIADVRSLTRIYELFKPYEYVRTARFHQADEKRLQARITNVLAQCEERFPYALHILRSEMECAKPATAAVQAAYSTIRSACTDATIEGTRSSVSFRELIEYRREVQHLFSGPHIINTELQKNCERVQEILSIAANVNEREVRSAAKELALYAQHESQRMQLRLAEHFQYAAQNYPALLSQRGKSSLESQELVRLYENDCVAIDKQLSSIVHKAQHILTQRVQSRTALLVHFADFHTRDSAVRTFHEYGAMEAFQFIPCFLMHTDEQTAADLLLRGVLGKNATVYAPRTYRIRYTQEKLHTDTWNLALIGAPAAWDKTRGANATVAVIDTGIDYRHRDLTSRFESNKGVDFVNENDPLDDNGHGTHVAGTIAGARTGVAPEAMLYAVKVLDSQGTGSEVSVLKGIEWAITQNVSVVNMSLGSPHRSRAEADLISYAAKQGIALACAAGNDGDSSYNYPASYPGAISVAAVDREKRKARFSNSNDAVDLAAPGVAVYSTWIGDSYNVLSGTSMATPHVAGACALLTSLRVANPEGVLKKTAEHLGEKEQFGSGLIALAEATR
jgi:hypothetical protein